MEHPADDEQAIDEAWLTEVGFIRSDHPPSVFHEQIEGRLTFKNRPDLDPEPFWDWVVDGNLVACLFTRGQVRRLAAALGITLRETPAGPAGRE